MLFADEKFNAERFPQFSEALTPEPPMKVTLKDGAPRSVGHVDINVSKNGNTVEIGAVGVEPAPIVLEFYEGKLTLRVYNDGDGTPSVIKQIRTASHPHAASADKTLAAANDHGQLDGHTHGLGVKSSAKETVNAVFPPPAPAAEFDEAAFDAA